MKIKLLQTSKVLEVCTSYALRLIEQGKAIAVPAEVRKPTRKANAKAGDA